MVVAYPETDIATNDVALSLDDLESPAPTARAAPATPSVTVPLAGEASGKVADRLLRPAGKPRAGKSAKSTTSTKSGAGSRSVRDKFDAMHAKIWSIVEDDDPE